MLLAKEKLGYNSPLHTGSPLLSGEPSFKFKSTTSIKKQEVDINIKIDLANLSASVNGKSGGSQEKMKTSLTVSQIAYLARIFFDSELIAPDNKSEVLAKMTNCLVTKNAAQISIKSLKSKFYSPEPATKLSIKKLLQTLAESIDVYE